MHRDGGLQIRPVPKYLGIHAGVGEEVSILGANVLGYAQTLYNDLYYGRVKYVILADGRRSHVTVMSFFSRLKKRGTVHTPTGGTYAYHLI